MFRLVAFGVLLLSASAQAAEIAQGCPFTTQSAVQAAHHASEPPAADAFSITVDGVRLPALAQDPEPVSSEIEQNICPLTS